MAGGQVKRPTAPDSQRRSKRNKTKSSDDAVDQAIRPEQSDPPVEPADVDVDEFEDDPTIWNPITSQVRRALEQVKKPDHWPRDFAKSIKERQSALLDELEAKSQAIIASEQQFTTQFRNFIAAAFETESTSASHHLRVTHTTPTTEALYQKSSTLLDESKNLLAQYRQLVHQPSVPSHLAGLAKKFAADRDQTAHAIDAGRRVADAEIDDMLADRLREVRNRKANITAADETLGKQILQLGRSQRPELAELDPEGWGSVAHRAQRAVEKLYKVTVIEE